MNKFYSNKAFKLGIFAGIFIYVLLYNYNQPPAKKSLCFDCDDPTGFPFISYVPGNAIVVSHTVWIGLIGNILFATLLVFIIGLITNFIVSKISSRRANLK